MPPTPNSLLEIVKNHLVASGYIVSTSIETHDSHDEDTILCICRPNHVWKCKLRMIVQPNCPTKWLLNSVILNPANPDFLLTITDRLGIWFNTHFAENPLDGRLTVSFQAAIDYLRWHVDTPSLTTD